MILHHTMLCHDQVVHVMLLVYAIHVMLLCHGVILNISTMILMIVTFSILRYPSDATMLCYFMIRDPTCATHLTNLKLCRAIRVVLCEAVVCCIRYAVLSHTMLCYAMPYPCILLHDTLCYPYHSTMSQFCDAMLCFPCHGMLAIHLMPSHATPSMIFI